MFGRLHLLGALEVVRSAAAVGIKMCALGLPACSQFEGGFAPAFDGTLETMSCTHTIGG